MLIEAFITVGWYILHCCEDVENPEITLTLTPLCGNTAGPNGSRGNKPVPEVFKEFTIASVGFASTLVKLQPSLPSVIPSLSSSKSILLIIPSVSVSKGRVII